MSELALLSLDLLPILLLPNLLKSWKALNRRSQKKSHNTVLQAINTMNTQKQNNANNRRKRSVQFRQIIIIELPIILGDSPSLSTGGPPMSIGWEAIRRTEFELDFYEKYRPKRKATRRELIVSASGRKNL
jgi:hypothetical protein